MPQLIALAMASALAYTGYRWISKYRKRKFRMTHARNKEPDQPRDLGELCWDETDGVYRPRR
ncbi:MAG: hypothetical protein HRT83_05860 [Hyphomicrobiaceae bacterium]|nr:hypothetical protein [Hyphomicrobiaceae bacterium]